MGTHMLSTCQAPSSVLSTKKIQQNSSFWGVPEVEGPMDTSLAPCGEAIPATVQSF